MATTPSQAVLDKKKARQAQMSQANTLKTAVDIGKSNPFILPESKPTSIATRNYSTSSVPSATPKQTAPVNNPATPIANTKTDEDYYKNIWKTDPDYAKRAGLPTLQELGIYTDEMKTQDLADSLYKEENIMKQGLASDLGLDKTKFSTIEEAAKQLAAYQLKEKEAFEAQKKAQTLSQSEALSMAHRQGEGAIGAMTANLAPGREGVMSGTALGTANTYKNRIERKLEVARADFDAAQKQIEMATANLELAQQQGQEDLVNSYREQIARAELRQKEAEADVLEQSRMASEEARAVDANKRSNLDSFTALVNDGQELSVSSIMGFANQLNLPFEDAYGYYEGVQKIRDDKNLDLAGKQIELEKLNLDLQNTMTGGALEVQRKVDYFTQLASSGLYSNDQLGALASAMDLNNSNNPVFQAEQRMNAADLAIKEYEAANLGNPPPAGTVDRLDYDIKKLELQKAQMELQDVYGTAGGAYVPTNTPKEGTNAYFENGQYVVTSDPNLKYSCAAGVNRLLGTSFGDEYTQKAGIVQNAINNGTGVSGADAALNPSMIKPGMIFVMPTSGNTAKWGHVGIVRSVNPETGKFTASEWNANGAMTQGGVLPGENNQTNTNQYNINQMYGFMQPPNSTLQGGEVAPADSIYSKYYDQAIKDGFSKEEATKFAQGQYTEAYKPPTEVQAKKINAITIMQEESDLYSGLIESIDQEKFADALNIIARKTKDDDLLGDVLNKYSLDPEVQRAIYSEMRWLEATLREESGAAISVGEYKSKGRQYFPRPGDSEQTLKDKERARQTALDGKYNALGPKADVIFAEKKETPKPTPAELRKQAEEEENNATPATFTSTFDNL